MKKKITNKNWIGTALIVLLWCLNMTESFHIPMWQKIIRASMITLILVSVFHTSKYFYGKIDRGEAKWYTLLFTHIGFLSTGFLINLIFVNPKEAAIQQEESYLEIIFLDMLILLPIIFISLISWAFYLFDKNKKSELAISRLTALNKESELNELKKQLNPHFLFNALSNIYSIAYLKDDQTPDKIMQLSKMLRYVIYETDVNFIVLSKEIEYLRYYIDFQKFKIEKEQQIDFHYQGADDSLNIAPLLLLPFIENAFKHSQVAIEADAWVKIQLWTTNKTIHFSVENSISPRVQPEILNNPGIGLDNIKKRLELVYKSDAQLNITQEDTFKAYLKIQTT